MPKRSPLSPSSPQRKGSGFAVGPIGSSVIFLIGIGLGHLHASYFASSSSSYSFSWLDTTISETTTTTTSLSSLLGNNGWKTMDVFVGKEVDHQSERGGLIQNTGTANETATFYHSQAQQDEVVLSLLRNKTNGYFVDLAANDAFLLSNTAALERHFDWTGLCIEGNPEYWHNLTHLRTCQVVGAVIGDEYQRGEGHKFRMDAGDHSGIAGEGFDNGPRHRRNAPTLFTVPLREVLDRFHAPAVIDYLSLDVEGAEFLILQNFPFGKPYQFKIMTIERPKENVRQVIEAQGYEFQMRLSRWGETLWIHKSFKDELDLSELPYFGPKAIPREPAR